MQGGGGSVSTSSLHVWWPLRPSRLVHCRVTAAKRTTSRLPPHDEAKARLDFRGRPDRGRSCVGRGSGVGGGGASPSAPPSPSPGGARARACTCSHCSRRIAVQRDAAHGRTRIVDGGGGRLQCQHLVHWTRNGRSHHVHGPAPGRRLRGGDIRQHRSVDHKDGRLRRPSGRERARGGVRNRRHERAGHELLHIARRANLSDGLANGDATTDWNRSGRLPSVRGAVESS